MAARASPTTLHLLPMRIQTAMAALLVGACADRPEPIDKPTPPDMGDVVRRFEQPDGVFDQAGAKRILEDYAALAIRINEVGLHIDVVDAVQSALSEALSESEKTQSAALSTDVTPTGAKRQALSLAANGTLGIKRIYAGWAATPSPAPENGSLSLRVNFSERGLDPVAWGDAANCRFLTDGARVLVDEGSGRKGDLRLWLGRSATFKSFGDQNLIFDLDLKVEVEDVGDTAALSFGFEPSAGLVSVSVGADDQSRRVVVSPSSPSVLTVAAQNGTFECNLTDRECRSDVGQSFSF